jgi:hypothetical protein
MSAIPANTSVVMLSDMLLTSVKQEKSILKKFCSLSIDNFMHFSTVNHGQTLFR